MSENSTRALETSAAALLNDRVQSLEHLDGGRNSRVFRLALQSGRQYALKEYFHHPSDPRDRLQTEYGALSFLNKNVAGLTPAPVACNVADQFAVYEWIDGRKLTSDMIDHSTINTAASFLGTLFDLRQKPGADAFGIASESVDSGAALLAQLRARLRPLQEGQPHPDLRQFIDNEFAPSLARLSDWSRARLGAAFDRPIGRDAMTLSPSDFGFHNALLTPAGAIIFLDFEYFGWDDPTKLIADFLLHPAMALSPEQKRRFTALMLERLRSISFLKDRVNAFYPLYGLKWCLILLNEFRPEQLLRRHFATVSADDVQMKYRVQLAKARGMLQRVLEEYQLAAFFA